ncbi:hypothetical protein [Archangium sp.]|uniref:hypothetical protein n=1 Tax=Archangium sp. TaxID=1872627 RepID=UPI002D513DF5|nr:hypothetical protein [Archangium sp.]HYO55538.1 hypothetical protein [Archangium sp.]
MEHAPRDEAPALQELTLMLQRLSSALARVEDRGAHAHLTREPLPRSPEGKCYVPVREAYFRACSSP